MDPKTRGQFRLPERVAGYTSLMLMLLLSIAFNAAIITRYWAHPWTSWYGSSFFGRTWYGAFSIGLHFVGGFVTNTLGVLQLTPFIRQRWLAFHRWCGRAFLLACAVAVVGGTLYIALVGTVGGIEMDIAFLGNATLISVFAVQAYRAVKAGDTQKHARYAIRLFSQTIGSALYRVLILPLYLADEGSMTAAEFVRYLNTASWLFYLPNLVVAECFIQVYYPPPPQDNWLHKVFGLRASKEEAVLRVGSSQDSLPETAGGEC
jgi:hypothetical protein